MFMRYLSALLMLLWSGAAYADSFTPPSGGSTATGTAGATLCLLNSNCTFSGSNTHSGPELFGGSAAAFSANGQVILLGGTTPPVFNASAMNTLSIGGYYGSTSVPGLTAGGANIFLNSIAGGLAIQSNVISLLGPTGGLVAQTTFRGMAVSSLLNTITGNIAFSGGAPTVTSGFGTVTGTIGTKNGTYRFDVNTNIGGTSGVVGLPTATTDWKCSAQSKNNPSTLLVLQTGYGTASATFAPYTLSGALDAWRASDVIAISCVAN